MAATRAQEELQRMSEENTTHNRSLVSVPLKSLLTAQSESVIEIERTRARALEQAQRESAMQSELSSTKAQLAALDRDRASATERAAALETELKDLRDQKVSFFHLLSESLSESL